MEKKTRYHFLHVVADIQRAELGVRKLACRAPNKVHVHRSCEAGSPPPFLSQVILIFTGAGECLHALSTEWILCALLVVIFCCLRIPQFEMVDIVQLHRLLQLFQRLAHVIRALLFNLITFYTSTGARNTFLD